MLHASFEQERQKVKPLPASKASFPSDPSGLIFANLLHYFTAKREHALQHKDVSVLPMQTKMKPPACGTVADGGSHNPLAFC